MLDDNFSLVSSWRHLPRSNSMDVRWCERKWKAESVQRNVNPASWWTHSSDIWRVEASKSVNTDLDASSVSLAVSMVALKANMNKSTKCCCYEMHRWQHLKKTHTHLNVNEKKTLTLTFILSSFTQVSQISLSVTSWLSTVCMSWCQITCLLLIWALQATVHLPWYQ